MKERLHRLVICHLSLIICVFTSAICHLTSYISFAQPKVLDGVVAIVGSSPILQSEVESKRVQAKLDSVEFDRCSALEDLLYQKLLLAQAIKDSVEITDEQVEEELERRLRYYIQQFGSVLAFENFYGKNVEKFKEEFREELREVLLVQKMQAKVTDGITVSPSEVKDFFDAIPKDSIPLINAEIEVGHIMRKPKINPELKKYAKEKLETIRQEIIAGKKDFSTAAILYSEDPGSASKGGLYDHVQRGTFVPEFDAMAFRMKEKEVSEIFETDFGYHILMVEARRGEEIDVRHILLVPQPAPEDLLKAKTFLDSIADLVKKDSISITEAASRFSDDEDTKHTGGLISNPYTGSTKFEMSQLSQIDANLVFTTDKLKTGELSATELTQSHDGKQSYHIIYVKSRTEPHRANLKEDYQLMQDEALAAKKDKEVSKWIKKKITSNYIRVSEEYKNCKFDNKWIN
ncbi:MAG: peptidylprolyl isomerase [Bacteroidetes bacterium]|nr:peptidylprolyl isomerase [Bacteroidota bacterium]